MHPEIPEPFRGLMSAQKYAEAASYGARAALEFYARGVARIRVGREQEARADFDACVSELGDLAAIELAFLDIRQRGDLVRAHREAKEIAARAGRGTYLRGRACHVLGLAEGKRRHSGLAISALLEALAEHSGDQQREERGEVRDTLGMVFAAQGRLEQAATYYGLSIIDKTRVGDRYGLALTLGNLGRLHLRAGRAREALHCFELDLEIAVELGDRRAIGRMHEDIGRVWLELGELGRARDEFRQTLALAEEQGYSDLEFFARKDLAVLAAKEGRHGEALEELEQAERSLKGGEEYLRTVLLATRGECLAAAGRAEAIGLLESAADEFARLDLPDLEIGTRVALAEVLEREGEPDEAEASLMRAAALARRDGFSRHLPRIREVLARLEIVTGLRVETTRRRRTPGEPLAESRARTKGGYVLLELLGEGGFGQVWRAFDPEYGAVVALKTLVLEGEYDPDTRAVLEGALQRELDAAARIRSPGVARVLAVGRDEDDHMYLVQEFVPGTPLEDSLPKGPTADLGEVLRVVGKIAFSLQELHAQGVFHRDLKPSNVLRREANGDPVLIDFGLARLEDDVRDWERDRLMGTLQYMAPEQALGLEIDGQADVYSLGVITFEWLTGRRPNEGDTALGDGVRIVDDDPGRSLAKLRPGLPSELVTFVRTLLAVDPKQRPVPEEVGRRCQELALAL